ncbi:MAG: class I SAM-dependent methyltransferase [Elusimicrobiales bacterium]|nr:class I SAM-dependent methyltransferase [Elusimicrobiales bacterium]
MASKIVLFYNYIYGKYRIINSIITFGLDNLWRKKAVKIITRYIKDSKDTKIADCGCGCGDMTFYLKKFFKKSSIIGIDGNLNMISIAEKKVRDVTFLKAELENLPFEDESFDAVIVSFATRNIYYSENREKIFSEIYRVLKKNGIFFSLETTYPDNIFLSFVFKIYIEFIFALLFIFISLNEKKAYSFLKLSILRFKDKYFIERISNMFCIKRVLFIPYVVSLNICFKRSYQFF